MKKAKYILLFPFILTSLASCNSDSLSDGFQSSKGEGITFYISSPVNESEWLTRSAEGDTVKEKLSSLIYLLADGDGKVLTHHYGRLSSNLDRLNLDGLRAGDYSVVFLGSSNASDLAQIETPETLDEAWLSNTMEAMPVEGTYFFKKVDFNVSLAPEPISREVMLDRALSKVKIEIPGIKAAVEEMVTSVKISLDDDSRIFTTLNADGSYAGEATVKDYELRDSTFNLTFNTLPSDGAVSGHVKIEAKSLSGEAIVNDYRFEGINVEAGKVATLTINLRHPDFETGFILVRPKDYYDYNADLMMMEDEPLDILHDNNHRRYTVTHPLMITSWENDLRVRLFSAGPVDDVDIYADFPSLGLDSVHMAHFDRVEAFLDMLVPMPFMERACNYYDVHGKRVTIPQMTTLPSDVKWHYKTPDPYLDQLDKLKFSNWTAWCPAYESWWSFYALTPTNDLIRHGYIINQCLAIMFDSPEFYARLEANTGNYINNGNYLTNEDIIQRIYNTAGFGWGRCNPSSGAEGWGGGSTMIFMDYYFNGGMYPGTDTNRPTTWSREVLFHEHGHCLGFSHTGNMTYGGMWVGVTSNAYIECFLNGKMPYGVPDFVRNIPYKRADAPKWAKPRFVIPQETEEPATKSTRSTVPEGLEPPVS
ncbi:MAG: hypothetical protein K2K95_00170 [Muribaculaceae bacterium]|nr:hypothetical protein [Muribaculaceae bacterium]